MDPRDAINRTEHVRVPHTALHTLRTQEGCVTLKPRTVGSRDAIYRTAVEAAIAVALDPVESEVDIGDVAPIRWVGAPAYNDHSSPASSEKCCALKQTLKSITEDAAPDGWPVKDVMEPFEVLCLRERSQRMVASVWDFPRLYLRSAWMSQDQFICKLLSVQREHPKG
eukprot:474568-Pelagomonas_calceolata.AAC.3